MAIWLVRGGAHGEYEAKFLQEMRVYATWDDLGVDVSEMQDRKQLISELEKITPDAKPRTISNWASQVWPFAHTMTPGDLVILPLKSQRAIQVGEITGKYCFDAASPSPFQHWRTVKWVGEAIPRGHFSGDLLSSFGAFMTICRIQRNNAEDRIRTMRESGWKPEKMSGITKQAQPQLSEAETEPENTDLEELARDQISRIVEARFKGHGLTRLVEAILQAQGYTTYRSPEGADGGADILAGAGPLGFGAPRLCVEVKSESGPIDRPTVDKLLGAVTKFGAQEGLFVSWSGFKSTVPKELAASFFRVRLWSQKEILEHLFANYEKMDEDLKAELPLKRIWTIAAQED